MEVRLPVTFFSSRFHLFDVFINGTIPSSKPGFLWRKISNFFRNCSPWICKGDFPASKLPGWRIKITGMPTSNWWVAQQEVFFGKIFPKNTSKKTFY
jgi:hypothetical protein